MTNAHSKILGTLDTDGFMWWFGNCYYNAYYNKKYVKEWRNLRVVVGSLGINGHYEYGGKKHTDKEYYKNPFDSHCWLEDENGNVYDYFFGEYNRMAMLWTGNRINMSPQVIAKAPKERLRLFGLDYIPASAKAQQDILRNVQDMYRLNRNIGQDVDLSVFC
jgi:hypothetical protein